MSKSQSADGPNHTKVFVRADFASSILEYMQGLFGATVGLTDSQIEWTRRNVDDSDGEFVELLRVVPPLPEDASSQGVKIKRRQ